MGPKANAASAAAVRDRFDTLGIVYSDTWTSWSRGDTCGIEDEGGIFKIMGFRSNGSGVVVSVVGGPVSGQAQVKEFRTFDATKLSKRILKRGSKTVVKDDNPE